MRSVLVVIVPPELAGATWAAATTRGVVENRFVSLTRTCEPPAVVQTIVRRVWFLIWLGTVAWTVVVVTVVTVVDSSSGGRGREARAGADQHQAGGEA
jgi:hypothetical protein